MIEVAQLTKRYGERTAVRDLSFHVKSGEVVGFLGPNGAGKSTTLRMLTGFLLPSSGQIRVAGMDAVTDSLEVRRRVGYMPEAVPLYMEMRVAEYLRYRAALKGVARRDIPRRVDEALSLAHVADVRTRIIGQLSKGYRQRVGLADALVSDPELLILDEPTAGLDPNQIRQVRALIRELAREKTVLLSTHILPEVEAICGRVVIIDGGRLVSEGRPEELRQAGAGVQVITLEARGAREALEKVLGGVDGLRPDMAIDALSDGGGDWYRARVFAEGEQVQTASERIFRAIAEAGLSLRALTPQAATLEDVFARLTTAEEVQGASAPGEGSDAPANEGSDEPAEADARKA